MTSLTEKDMAVRRMPTFTRVKSSLIVFSLAQASCGTTTDSTEFATASSEPPTASTSSTIVDDPPTATATSALPESSTVPEVTVPDAGHSEVREGGVSVHVGMECPNMDLAFTAESDWAFEVDEVIPAPLTLDSEIRRGSWSNSEGSTVVLLVPASYPVGETAHDFGMDSPEWEEVIVPTSSGWRFGVRPLVEGADEFAPRCNVAYLTEGLSLEDFIVFVESTKVEGDM